jgi:LysR family glycine cleavage system transcriptional activator
LQAAEAAARHLNMRKAAEELGVTPSAVSHNVRAVEAALGRPLFAPSRRRLALTPEGRVLTEAVRRALDEIAGAGLQVIEEGFAGALSVAAPPALMSQWLVPRLPRFLALFPDLEVSLTTISPDHAGPLPRVDLAILFNRDQFPGMHVETFVRVSMFPVCAQALARGPLPMPPESLRGATLIHEDDGAIWARWFASVGIAQSGVRRSVRVASTQDALALARAGVGFAIDDDFMSPWGSDPGAANGALVRPFGRRSFEFGRYALVTQPPEKRPAVVSAFAGWLRSEHALRPGMQAAAAG